MRLYKIVASNKNDDGPLVSETHWVGSLSEGVSARKQLALTGFSRKEITETETEVPTDKAGLLAFLNANVQ